MDNALRQEQAGFRPGRSCNDQMFTLRQILETVTAGRNPTIFNFIDFCKAFDSVHRPALWKILRMYVRLSRANNIYSAPNAQSEPMVTLVNGSVCKLVLDKAAYSPNTVCNSHGLGYDTIHHQQRLHSNLG